MTLTTPLDITTGIGTLTANGTLTAQYLAGRGTPTVINVLPNVNPGDVQTDAGPLRISLFSLNLVPDPNDATDSYTLANPGTVAIGSDTIINNFIVNNQDELTPLQTEYINANSKNLYQPENPVVYDILTDLILNQTPNTPQNPYVTEDMLNNADPTQLVLGDFLNTPTASTPLSALLGADLNVANLLTEPGIKNDTLLAQIGALELKFHLEARMASKLASETLGWTTIDDMLTNPLKIAEALKNPASVIERGNADITTFKGNLGKLASFVSDVSGLGGLSSAFFKDDSVLLKPTGISDYDSDQKLKNRDIDRLEETGKGQRFMAFSNLTLNKYIPDYVTQLTNASGARTYKRLRKGQGNEPEYDKPYLGNANQRIFDLLTDQAGNQVLPTAEITELLKENNTYSEPGVENVSSYGSLQTSFIWRGSTEEKYWDPTIGSFSNGNGDGATSFKWDKNLENNNLSKSRTFRNHSIMSKTQELLNSSENNVMLRSIDQTKTKFSDGYNFASKGSGVISPFKKARLNKNNEVIGYDYLVPGLDISGKRDDKRMYDEVELCRTWTKAKPFSKVTDLIRWKELNRKERNSVLDRYGNLNIHPSALNVNEGYGRLGDGLGDAVVEGFGEKRARKYMFSLENLAWRDATLFKDLPPCEKGSNGGRIMWFPPYNMRFTDDTNTNWTTHQFLGRPEPIYTYNNTERSGTLSWDIVVDHPSILNLLVSKEFASITDGEVDELLAAFWAGCLEYDIFELARIWGVFTDSDIEYFKKVIADLDVRLPNEKIRGSVESSGSFRSRTVQIESTENIEPVIPEFNLFFENDIPLKNYNPETFKIEPFNTYFETYRELASLTDETDPRAKENHKYKKAKLSGEPINQNEAGWIRYDKTIGTKSKTDEHYFFEKDRVNFSSDSFGYDEQYETIQNDISNLTASAYAAVKEYNLSVNMVAHASPSAPGSTSSQIRDYNNKLASRRFVSVVKWLILNVLSNDTIKCYNINDGTEITISNVDGLFGTDLESSTYVQIQRGDINEPNIRQIITFNVDAINAGLGITTDDIFEGDFIVNFGPPTVYNDVKYYKVSYGTDTYYAVATYDEYDKLKDNFNINGTLLDNKFIGTFLAVRTNNNGGITAVPKTQADIICGNLSPQASYCRRVGLITEIEPKELVIERVPPKQEDPPLIVESKNVQTNVTKREIAQRILGKLLTECDYFEFLSEEAPIVYDSLKQKLKYFTPAFHSMTPEGLNARLTFLQQCMRPGETITKNNGSSCDAKNTSFGRPPVCVLRIGDFYHTKIIINNLNISYDPLVFDLNPEGIGVQPMLAKVSINFKYIGGQGLRRYVDELQTALSFNYYANTDVYDERTFANTDARERDLINLEQDFFTQNSLDLIPIVNQAELITPSTQNLEIPAGTIGVISTRLLPKLAGGTYYNSLVSATPFSSSVSSYNPESCVIWQGQYYVRNTTKLATEGLKPEPSDTKYWTAIDHSNFGELAFREEYGRNYIQRYEIKYDGLFTELYKTFGEYTNTLVYGSTNSLGIDSTGFIVTKSDTKLETSVGEKYRIVSDILKNKNYNTPISTTGETISSLITSISGNTNSTYTSASITGLTYAQIFNDVAKTKRYIELGEVFKQNPNFVGTTSVSFDQFEAIKLNLYPQEYMFKVGDGLGLPYGFGQKSSTALGDNGMSTKFFPGNLTNGYSNNRPDAYSETGGIFFKETTTSRRIYQEIMDSFAEEFKTKISLNTLAIWSHTLEPTLTTFNNFHTDLDDAHRIMFKTYLNEKFSSYYAMLTNYNTESNDEINDKVGKMSVILAGLSLPVYGYDARYTEDGRAQLYEIIPNGKKLVTDVVDGNMFKYDPYKQYKKLGYTGGELITFKDVDNIFNESTYGSWSNLTIEDYISLGNGLYFFKQQTNTYVSDLSTETTNTNLEYTRNMDYIAKEFGYPTTPELPFQYDFSNTLPKSIHLSKDSSITGLTKNYFFDTPFSFNPGEYGTQTELETKANNLVMRSPQGNIINEAANYYNTNDYKMTYVWEKLNYEILDFSNKTLDLMLSDNLETELRDVDFTYTPSYEFDTQLDELIISGYTGGSTSGTTTGTTDMGSILFYYGDNKKPNNNIKPLNYYLFNENNPNITGTDLVSTLSNLNKALPYDYTINDAFISALPTSNKNKIYLDVVGSVNPSLIKMSGMCELIFLEFLLELSQNKSLHIESLDKIFGESIAVPANIKSDDKKNKAYRGKKKKKIRKVLVDTFNLIDKLITSYNSDVLNLHTYNEDIKTETAKNINNNVFDDESSKLLTTEEIKKILIKGTVDDYTLVMRETSKLDNTIVKNLKIFTKYKNNPIINVGTTLEPKTEPKPITTKLAEQYPEVYNTEK
jgi:hypothetical protein